MSLHARAIQACQRMHENGGRPVHSDDLTHLALALPISARDRVLLCALASYAHTGRGPLEVWPSQETLARGAGMNLKTVIRALRSLEEGRFIRRDGKRRVPGSANPNRVYRLSSRVWVSLFAKENGWHPRDPAPPPKEEPPKQTARNTAVEDDGLGNW